MNITFIAHKLNLNGGGSNFSLDLIARSFLQRGHDVTVATLNFAVDNSIPNSVPYEIIEKPINKIEILKPSQIVSILNDLEEDSDLFHIFDPYIAPPAGIYRSKKGNVPVICRLNQYGAVCSDPTKIKNECYTECGLWNRIRHSDENMIQTTSRIPLYFQQTNNYIEWMNCADQYYAISPSTKEIYSGFGINNEIIETIPNFYDPEFPYTSDGNKSSHNSKILYVGRLSYEKGVDTLIKAIPHLDNKCSISIVGNGPQRQELEQLSNNLSLDDEITFHGYVDHELLADYYDDSDIFVHPGRWPEPFGRTILESWQMNCAVIVSDTGAPPWIVGDAGLVFPENDEVELANKINQYLNQPDLVKTMKYRGKNRLEQFQPKLVLNQLESLSTSLVTKENKSKAE